MLKQVEKKEFSRLVLSSSVLSFVGQCAWYTAGSFVQRLVPGIQFGKVTLLSITHWSHKLVASGFNPINPLENSFKKSRNHVLKYNA